MTFALWASLPSSNDTLRLSRDSSAYARNMIIICNGIDVRTVDDAKITERRIVELEDFDLA